MNFLPLPPSDIAEQATNTTNQTIMEIAIALGVIAVYVAAVRLRMKYDSWVPVAIALGSTFCALIEPLPDVVANLWYYAPDQNTLYTSYENPFPTWTYFSYTVVYGGFGLLFWRLTEGGWPRRKLLTACIPVAAYLAASELFMINLLDLYTYYGPAAFKVASFPVWICILNTTIVVSIGIVGARIRRSLAGPDAILAAFLLPGICMTLGLIFIPSVLWTLVHSADPDQGWIYAATMLVIATGVAMIHLATRFVPAKGFPVADGEKPAADLAGTA
ncbi:hypothetical protein GCM10009547_12490 [Sporichthya brevicatena]|uniref:Uncharacterized protein n=1 Tax=Sporichthya brevicatena TaxID=171442 RepID=A0ABN1GI10_9ACTN